jgi:hypothetical protein
MSKKQDGLIADLQETFDNLRKYNMMLNPTKCVFGVPAGQLMWGGFRTPPHHVCQQSSPTSSRRGREERRRIIRMKLGSATRRGVQRKLDRLKPSLTG